MDDLMQPKREVPEIKEEKKDAGDDMEDEAPAVLLQVNTRTFDSILCLHHYSPSFNFTKQGNIEMRSKIDYLLNDLKMLKEKDSKVKTLVFSQFQRTMNTLQTEIARAGLGCVTIEGHMTAFQRQKALDKFSTDDNTTVFLLSTRSGAAGLTLTAANHVYIMEPCLNSALELQAINRVHRIGQVRSPRFSPRVQFFIRTFILNFICLTFFCGVAGCDTFNLNL